MRSTHLTIVYLDKRFVWYDNLLHIPTFCKSRHQRGSVHFTHPLFCMKSWPVWLFILYLISISLHFTILYVGFCLSGFVQCLLWYFIYHQIIGLPIKFCLFEKTNTIYISHGQVMNKRQATDRLQNYMFRYYCNMFS